MPVWQGGPGGGLSLASVVSLASALDPTATGRVVPQPVGTCAEQRRGLPHGLVLGFGPG